MDDDAGSYASLKAHIHQIDMLFPGVAARNLARRHAAGRLDGAISGARVRRGRRQRSAWRRPAEQGSRPDCRAHEDTEIFPLINNYNVMTQHWDARVGVMLNNPAARQNLEDQLSKFFAAKPSYRGLSLDLEELPDDSIDGYHALIGELYRADAPKESAPLCQRERGRR